MIRGIREVFLALFDRGSGTDEEETGRRFVPSPLDLSVRVGHGGRDDEVERELSKIAEWARKIEGGRDGS